MYNQPGDKKGTYLYTKEVHLTTFGEINRNCLKMLIIFIKYLQIPEGVRNYQKLADLRGTDGKLINRQKQTITRRSKCLI